MASAAQQRIKYTDLLSKCSGTRNLSLDGEFELSFLAALATMRLENLALTVPSLLTGWTPADINHALLRTITHLDLFLSNEHTHSSWESWSVRASLPALTHLALSPSIASGILPQVVGECPHLRIVIMPNYSWARGTAFEFAQGLTVADPRIVVMAMMIDYQEDWERGVRRRRFLGTCREISCAQTSWYNRQKLLFVG
ncbi:hypothetical protein DFH06DRAFT_1250276 [Mycena polygramma]|nr:hypothetical protein DFH06DRAFT_1250276 [Mycena polygramma]